MRETEDWVMVKFGKNHPVAKVEELILDMIRADIPNHNFASRAARRGTPKSFKFRQRQAPIFQRRRTW